MNPSMLLRVFACISSFDLTSGVDFLDALTALLKSSMAVYSGSDIDVRIITKAMFCIANLLEKNIELKRLFVAKEGTDVVTACIPGKRRYECCVYVC